MPIDEQEQRAQLADAVARLHPNAKMRSFGGGAASFLDSHRLVVAHYGESDGQLTRDEPPEPGEPAEQQSLFAA